MKTQKAFVSLLAYIAFSALLCVNAEAQNSSDIQQAVNQRRDDELQQFYTARNFQPVWFANGQLNSRAVELRQAQLTISEHGLPVGDYWTSSLEQLFTANVMLSPADAAFAEMALSKNFVTVAKHISNGRVDPSKAGAEIKYTQRPFKQITNLARGVEFSAVASTWNSLAPTHLVYRDLQTILRKLMSLSQDNAFGPLKPASSTLKIGTRAAIVREIELRASAMGHSIRSVDDVYDIDTASAVSSIQRSNLTTVTGQLKPSDKVSWEYFSVSLARRIQQVELNLEKVRWLPQQLGSRYIFINLATQKMNLVDPSLINPVLVEQRVVVGRPERKTPSMVEDMEYVVFNPTWTVPPDIFRLDKVPAIQKAALNGPWSITSWFAENRMSLLDRNEKVVDPTAYDWISSPPRFGNVLIRQQPGTDNALGTMKFMMPNPYSIYLHDTNQPELLNEDFRMLSSGCIRLQYPRDFAEYLLLGTKWSRPAIDEFVVKPGETRPSESWVRLPNKVSVPVYIISLTAKLEADGVMSFTRDVYKQNADLLAALKSAGFYR